MAEQGTVKWFNDARLRLHQPSKWGGCVRAFLPKGWQAENVQAV